MRVDRRTFARPVKERRDSLIDYANAWSTERKVIELLQGNKKLKKYKLELHHSDEFGVDIEACGKGYEDLQ